MCGDQFGWMVRAIAQQIAAGILHDVCANFDLASVDLIAHAVGEAGQRHAHGIDVLALRFPFLGNGSSHAGRRKHEDELVRRANGAPVEVHGMSATARFDSHVRIEALRQLARLSAAREYGRVGPLDFVVRHDEASCCAARR